MVGLWAHFKQGLSASEALNVTEPWMPWGDLSKKWQALGEIEVVKDEQRQPHFAVRFGAREKTFLMQKFDLSKFRELVAKVAATGFSFNGHPDDTTYERPHCVGFMSGRTCPLSLTLTQKSDKDISPDLSEDLWDTAVSWLKLPGSLLLYGATPDPLSLFGDVTRPELPQVFSYHWMVYLRPDVLTLLGGINFVLADAPVERKQLIDTAEGAQGVLCRVGVSPQDVSDDQWRAWRTFLLPVLGEINRHFDSGTEFPRLIPEDRALFPNGFHIYEKGAFD
jgi:hypothetical protein